MRTDIRSRVILALGVGLVGSAAHADEPAAMSGMADMHKPAV